MTVYYLFYLLDRPIVNLTSCILLWVAHYLVKHLITNYSDVPVKTVSIFSISFWALPVAFEKMTSMINLKICLVKSSIISPIFVLYIWEMKQIYTTWLRNNHRIYKDMSEGVNWRSEYPTVQVLWKSTILFHLILGTNSCLIISK